MEVKLYSGILSAIFLIGSIEARTLTCTRENIDGSQSDFNCDTNCCGPLLARVCCPDPSDPKNLPQAPKTLATELVAAIVSVVVVFAVCVIVFSAWMWCRHHPPACLANMAETRAKKRENRRRPRRGGHDTGLSTGLGHSAFPTRLHPSLVQGFNTPARLHRDPSSMDPGFFSSDPGSTTHGGRFSHQGAAPTQYFA